MGDPWPDGAPEQCLGLIAAALMVLPEVCSVGACSAGEGVPPFRMTLQSDKDFVQVDSEGDILWAAGPWSSETGDGSCDTACDPPTGCRHFPSRFFKEDIRLGKHHAAPASVFFGQLIREEGGSRREADTEDFCGCMAGSCFKYSAVKFTRPRVDAGSCLVCPPH